MSFRDQIKAYVDDTWFTPAKDGIVWVYYAGIDTAAEAAKHGRSTKTRWSAAFLQYSDVKFTTLEGLYLIPSADLGKVKAGQLAASSYPDRKMIASWFDNKDKDASNAEVAAQKPAHHGLNDCAHFVTQSLAAGGIAVQTVSVPDLFNKLRGLSDTKTLAKTVTAAAAQNVIDSKIMKPGDVIIYSEGTSHHHSVVYMGDGKIGMHTWANHPDHPSLKGDWKGSATSDHPLVTLIHFGRDDKSIDPSSNMLGWWKVMWRGTPYYYYFEKSGRVGWARRAPTNTKQALAAPDGRGYWFEDPSRVGICWTETGSFENLAVRAPRTATHMEGMWNGTDRLTADKIP